MLLPQLYHWSPTSRRKQIIRHGLIPGSRPTIATIKTVGGADETGDCRYMTCLSTTPSAAWDNAPPDLPPGGAPPSTL